MSTRGRTPILVGIGTATRREDDWRQALEPLDLMLEAVRAAAADSGVPSALSGLDLICVPRGRWKYRNPAGAIARAVGATHATSVLATPGVLQQALIGDACERIARGEVGSAVVTGADAGHRLLRAQIAGEQASEALNNDDPDILQKPKDDLRHPVEVRAGLQMPVGLYAILESAFRAKLGRSVAEHRDLLATLYARLSRIATANPHAWNRTEVPATDIREPSKHNPMQAFPYTRYHCSTWNVDQAAALLLCSVERAQALGIPEHRWIYPVVSTASNYMVPVSARANLADLPGARITGRAALERAGLAIEEVDLVELYSCFPIAIELYASAVGIPLTRDVTVTGGMAFAGGPYNNYFLQATCRAIELMRQGRGRNALLSCVSGIVTKQAFAIWSLTRPAEAFANLDLTEAVSRETGVREVVEDFSGLGVIAGYTVLHGRGQTPKCVALVDTHDGKRAMVTSEDAGLVVTMQESEFVGRAVVIRDNALVGLR